MFSSSSSSSSSFGFTADANFSLNPSFSSSSSATPLFGATSAPSFGFRSPNSSPSTNLFGVSASPSFGSSPAATNAFGSANSRPGSTASTPLFGSPFPGFPIDPPRNLFGYPSSSSDPTGTNARPFSSGLFAPTTPSFSSGPYPGPQITSGFGGVALTDRSPHPFSGTAKSPASASSGQFIIATATETAASTLAASPIPSSAASTATTTAASSATAVFLPSITATNTDSSLGTTGSLSAQTLVSASSGQSQSTVAAPLNGPPSAIGGSCSGCSAMLLKVDSSENDREEEVKADVKQGNDGSEKQAIVVVNEPEAVVSGLRTDQDVIKKVVKVEVSSLESEESAEFESNPSVISTFKVGPSEAILVTPNAPMAETVPTGDEESAHGTVSQTFCASAPFIDAPFIDVKGYCISSQKGQIVKQIFDKYGDITDGSTIKSKAAKSGFLELVAAAVDRLCNHTIKTLKLDELQLIEQHTADALAVGFHVNWLQQRIEKITAASDYCLLLVESDKVAKQIADAKKHLVEMELKQMICTKEVAAIKDKMDINGFGESNLGEGLL